MLKAFHTSRKLKMPDIRSTRLALFQSMERSRKSPVTNGAAPIPMNRSAMNACSRLGAFGGIGGEAVDGNIEGGQHRFYGGGTQPGARVLVHEPAHRDLVETATIGTVG